MKFVNNNNKPVKVEREDTDPAESTTLKRNGTIECAGEKFAKYYEEKGLTLVEVKAVESKAGTATVETKMLKIADEKDVKKAEEKPKKKKRKY